MATTATCKTNRLRRSERLLALLHKHLFIDHKAESNLAQNGSRAQIRIPSIYFALDIFKPSYQHRQRPGGFFEVFRTYPSCPVSTWVAPEYRQSPALPSVRGLPDARAIMRRRLSTMWNSHHYGLTPSPMWFCRSVSALLVGAGSWFTRRGRSSEPGKRLGGTSGSPRSNSTVSSPLGYHVLHDDIFMHISRVVGKCPNCGNNTSEGFHVPQCGGLNILRTMLRRMSVSAGLQRVSDSIRIVPYLESAE